MADLQKLVDELSALTVLEAAELSKLLESKWRIVTAANTGQTMQADESIFNELVDGFVREREAVA